MLSAAAFFLIKSYGGSDTAMDAPNTGFGASFKPIIVPPCSKRKAMCVL